MITIDNQESRISITVLGEFTLADFKEFEDTMLATLQADKTVELLFDLREMVSFTVDVAWEEIRFSRQHARDFRRIAVLTDSQWVAWSVWLEHLFVETDLRVFSNEDDALAWLATRSEE